ncbi:DUF1707 domain-containing protein [Kribbella sp. NPDC051770]|uniref:DUF1707 SHOCT-like domain-containing protein n=1 Tax=Kribbella sp. NPDC051770 TaxID=3155413 RepID=UPI00343CFC49
MNENVRVGDDERQEAVRRLGEHYEAGRLTAEEHSERISQALQAKTAGDLAALFADLPGEKKAEAGPQRPSWSGQRPPWAARGPLGRVPLPLLIALAGLAVLLSVGCVVGGGHPPVLPLLLIVAAFVFVKKRRHA